MATVAEKLKAAVSRNPGQSDRFYSKELQLHQSQVNQESRLLAWRSELVRRKRSDGRFGTYPVGTPLRLVR